MLTKLAQEAEKAKVEWDFYREALLWECEQGDLLAPRKQFIIDRMEVIRIMYNDIWKLLATYDKIDK